MSAVLVATSIKEPIPGPTVECRPLSTQADWDQALQLTMTVDEALGTGREGFYKQLYMEWRRLSDAGQRAWFGALIDGRLRCGLGVFTDGSGVARYQAVGTDPAYRRRGLARQLVAWAGRFLFAGDGVDSLVIVAEEHAAGLYRDRYTGIALRARDC